MPSTGRARGGNLPVELSSFVGRRRELAEVKPLLAEARLVTLTGVGGTGKTRLAQRVATDLRRAFADGTWFIDLTHAHRPGPTGPAQVDQDAMAYLVAATLGLREQPGRPPMRLLTDQLADQRALLVLDNCEHVLPSCAVLADTLLAACPGLRILATSREPLTVPGERIFLVPPLPLPASDPDRRPTLADVARTEAVALFIARARAVMPGFDLTEENRDAVAELCHRLDGLPLAIELAAARVRVLAPRQILDRVTERFDLLSRGSRTAPERQQTLRACVDWSFDLCTKSEQRLWARLTVFAGAFELDAIEGVCADDHRPGAELLDVLAGLVDKSIVARHDHGPVARYRMLDTLRDFGQEKLESAAERAALRRRHRDWYQRLVADANAEWISDRQPYWLVRLDREHPNLRAAMEYSLTEPAQAEVALRMVLCLPVHYWWSRSVLGECRRWLDRALDQTRAPTALRARALLMAGDLAFVHGDPSAGMRRLDQGEDLARRLGDPAALAHAAYARGIGALQQNDQPTAIESFERALTILSTVAGAGRVPEPEFDLHLRLLIGLGVAAAMAGRRDRAGACRTEMLTMTERLGLDFYRSSALWSCGLVTWLDGDPELAATEIKESLRLKQTYRLGDDFGAALCLEVLAWIMAARQRHRRAATLLGAADTIRTGQGTSITSFRHLLGYHEQCERRAIDAIGDTAFADAFREGQGLTYEDVLAYALDEPRAPEAAASGAAASTADAPAPLTRREWQIADLIGRGLSNRDIAATLVIAQRTAAAHVEHILAKLGFANRAQIAAWITARRLTEIDS